jgi:23S rRNA G2445 N2-methylase RlmL
MLRLMTRSPAARLRALKRHVWNARLRFEATCAPGFEELLEAEVSTLPGAVVAGRRKGARLFEGPYDALHQALLRLSVAESLRIVVIDDAAAATLAMLHDRLGRVDWTLWLPEACGVTLRLHASKSRLRDEATLRKVLAAALRAQGIDANVSEPGIAADFEIRLALHRDRMRLVLSVDGALHHHSGDKWVTSGGLRDSSATAVARLAFAAQRPDLILDPFCGAGTLLMAAHAEAAGRRAPRRDVAFAKSPAWRAERARHALRQLQLAEVAAAAPLPRLIGFDVARTAIEAAQRNLTQAGIAETVAVAVGDARRIDPAAIARGHAATAPLLLSNPPYGKGVEAIGDEPDALLAGLLRRASGWRFALLYPRPEAIARGGGVIEATIPTVTGGVRNAVVIGRVPEGKTKGAGGMPPQRRHRSDRGRSQP